MYNAYQKNQHTSTKPFYNKTAKEINDMAHKKWWDIVSKKRSKCLEKSEIGGKTGVIRLDSANYWYARGGSCIAIGSVGISMGLATDSPCLLILYLISGVVMILAGLSMIDGAYNIERKSEELPVRSSLIELRHTNKQLFCGFLLLGFWVFLIAITYLWFIFHLLFTN